MPAFKNKINFENLNITIIKANNRSNATKRLKIRNKIIV